MGKEKGSFTLLLTYECLMADGAMVEACVRDRKPECSRCQALPLITTHSQALTKSCENYLNHF